MKNAQKTELTVPLKLWHGQSDSIFHLELTNLPLTA